MNTAVWITQGILAAVFAASGFIILFKRKSLSNRLSWLKEYSIAMIVFICLAKIAGAAGLIIPMVAGVNPILTPLAAMGIATIMILAFAYHVRKKEYKDLPATILFFAMATFVAFSRLQTTYVFQ